MFKYSFDEEPVSNFSYEVYIIRNRGFVFRGYYGKESLVEKVLCFYPRKPLLPLAKAEKPKKRSLSHQHPKIVVPYTPFLRYSCKLATGNEKRMNPKIVEPTSDLAGFVKCYWTLESPIHNTPKRNTIVPDGTMKLIFHYGDLYWHHPENGERFLQPRCFLIGQLTKPYIVEPNGNTGTFVVRFHPDGFLPFTNMPLKEMTNTPIPLKKVFDEKGEKLENEILNAPTTAQRIRITESFLLELLKSKPVKDRIVKATVETISKHKGQLSVNELSSKTNINRSILTRKFSYSVGVSPKQLSKIVRLQATLKRLLQKEKTKLTDLAYENAYFDQAHFIKDFKEFTGITPKEFYGDALKMSLIFDKKT